MADEPDLFARAKATIAARENVESAAATAKKTKADEQAAQLRREVYEPLRAAAVKYAQQATLKVDEAGFLTGRSCIYRYPTRQAAC